MNYRELSSGSLPERDGSYTVLHQRNMPAVKHLSSLLLGIMGEFLLTNRWSQVPLSTPGHDVSNHTHLVQQDTRPLIGSSELTEPGAIRYGWATSTRYLSLWLAVGSAEQRLLKPSALAIRPARTFSKCRNDGIGSELLLKAYLGPCLVGRSWR